MSTGWIKLHRNLLDWEWYQDSGMVHLFLHLLLKANHKAGSWQGVRIEPGQFISGRNVLACETGLSEQTVRTYIKRLKSTSELTIKSTNKYSLFTLNNWKKYQSEKEPTNKLTNNQPTTNQQLTTNKNVKNEKNEKNNIKDKYFSELIPIDLAENIDFVTAWDEWIDFRQESKKPVTKISAKKQLKLLSENSKDAVEIIERSIRGTYQGLFELKKQGSKGYGSHMDCWGPNKNNN